MKSFINASILLFFIFCNLTAPAQNLQINSKLEKIKIQEDSSFVREISVEFKRSAEPRFYPIIFDTELEQVTDIKLFENKGRRLKPLPARNISEEDIKLDYIASKKLKVVEIPSEMEVTLTYLISCKELMYFSSLEFFSYNQIDTLKYQIKVPDKFTFTHNTVYKDSLSFFAIDSIATASGAEWNIKVSPKIVEPDPMALFGIYRNMTVPFMRTLVIPSSYNNKPTSYMNDWYFTNIAPQKGLDTSVKQKLDELTANVTEPAEIVNIIYSYVKSNFKYVAIEIGMGAFIPSPANEVYLNKQGDCKDLSNFLSEALKYKGIESDIALAATFNHISDCDFPSLSSANHVIGIAYINGETILLDPTDPIHMEGTPVQSLQGRTILIVNANGGSFYKVNGFSPQQNEIVYNLNLKIDSNDKLIKGTFAIDYKGISGNYLNRIYNSEGKKEFAEFADTFYDEVFGNQVISNLTVTKESNKLQFNGNIAITGKTFDDGPNKYLFIDFLPRLIETESREKLMEGTYLNNPFNKKVLVNIEMDEPIETFEPIEHIFNGEGMSLKVTIRAKSNMEIECYYDFIFNHIFIDKENITKTNEILDSFKKIINAPIVLETQKS